MYMNSYRETYLLYYLCIIFLYINYYISIFYHLSIYLASIYESKMEEMLKLTHRLCYFATRSSGNSLFQVL